MRTERPKQIGSHNALAVHSGKAYSSHSPGSELTHSFFVSSLGLLHRFLEISHAREKLAQSIHVDVTLKPARFWKLVNDACLNLTPRCSIAPTLMVGR